MNDPEVMAQSYEGLISRVVWALVLHPFDLIATRMITEASPRYATFRSSIEAATKVNERASVTIHMCFYAKCTIVARVWFHRDSTECMLRVHAACSKL
jgi:hypothetical protein